MLKLYYANPSRAIRPRWLLEEIGVPYELQRLDLGAGDQKRPEYLAINPNGTVPTLVDGELTLFESAAICAYLADRFPEAQLAPLLGTPDRGRYYQWMHYSMTAIDMPVISIFHHTLFKPEHERIAAIAEENRERLATALLVVDRALVGKAYILGHRFSAADIMMGSGLIWARSMHLIPPERGQTLEYVGRLAQRPAFQRASAD